MQGKVCFFVVAHILQHQGACLDAMLEMCDKVGIDVGLAGVPEAPPLDDVMKFTVMVSTSASDPW